MSRKKTQPKKNVVPDPKFNSTIIPKLINNIMYDGKRGVAAKIVYDAIEKIKTKSKDEPINIFNEAINNIKPTVEVSGIQDGSKRQQSFRAVHYRFGSCIRHCNARNQPTHIRSQSRSGNNFSPVPA